MLLSVGLCYAYQQRKGYIHAEGNNSKFHVYQLSKLIHLGHLMIYLDVPWPPDAKSQLTRKDPVLEKIESRRRGYDRGWDGWMASPTQWTWVWACSGSWWWTGKPSMLQCMGSQIDGHNWATELNSTQWYETTILNCYYSHPSQFWETAVLS